jgi:polyisoprenyl-teichoic acid--peptidoglycan teichoic acid transferase
MKLLSKDQYILFFMTGLIALSIYLSWTSPIARAVRSGKMINGLVIGTDYVDYCRHSDTLLFLNYDSGARFLTVMSIPRDTKFSPAAYNFRKINEVYAYHHKKDKNDIAACNETRNAIEELLQKKVSIPYFVQIDYASFKKSVDLIGGVDIDVEEPMSYDDSAGNLHIHFEAGKHHLNGEQALEYVRFRGVAGDVGRIFRQQMFFKNTVKKFKNPLLFMKLANILKISSTEIKTNLNFWDVLVTFLELKDLSFKDIRLTQLPGNPVNGYWVVDQEDTQGLLFKLYNSSSSYVSTGPMVRVEIWNASGKDKLAEKATWMLRREGFDVIEWGTFSVIQKKTLIKDMTGDLRSAQKIGRIISCGEVVTRYDAKSLANISVTLGEDCVNNIK